MSLSLLLTDISALKPVATSEAIAEAHRRQPPETEAPMPDELFSSGLLDDLGRQRWGIVAPAGADGEAMLAAVAPLRAWREQQMGAKALVFRVPPHLTPSEQRSWKYRSWARYRMRDRPRYLLILGDLHEVPLGVQQSLMAGACVGRLCFTTLDGAVDTDGYASYCRKIIDAERAAADWRHTPRLLFYANRNLADDALENHYAYVIKQCHKQVRANDDVPDEDILRFGRPGRVQWDEPGSKGRPEHLLHWAEQQHPSVLLSLCHGAGVTDPAEQRNRQGALVLTGERGKRVIDHTFFRDRSFLPGGFWLLNACFGAGTPARSVYHPWLEKLAALSGEQVTPAVALEYLARSDNRPFIARVPQAALANPSGPLGFLGHVDIVWGYGYRNPLGGTAADSSPYYGVIEALASGRRFGVAMRSLADKAAGLGLELAFLDPGDDPARLLLRTRLWLQCWDLSGYVLLGDPAARLPIRHARPASEAPDQQAPDQQKTDQQKTEQVLGGAATSPAVSGGADSIALEVMQAAVFRCIGGEDPAVVAADVGASPDRLNRWRAYYTDAGLAALRALRDQS